MYFNQRGDISTLNGSSLKLVDKFTYLGNTVSSTKKDVNTWLANARTAIDRLLVMEVRPDQYDKMHFFQVVILSILLSGCTTWTLTKRMEKKLDGNYPRILWVILNKSWRQNATKQQRYGHLPLIMKTIQARWTRHVGHCWRSKDGLISDILLWTPSHWWAKAGWPARTYIQQLCADTGCSLEDLPRAIDHRNGWQERVRETHAGSVTWWYIYIYIYIHSNRVVLIEENEYGISELVSGI